MAGAAVSVILLSQVAWGSLAFSHGTAHAARPFQISFPGYSLSELTSVRAPVPLSCPARNTVKITLAMSNMNVLSKTVWRLFVERWIKRLARPGIP